MVGYYNKVEKMKIIYIILIVLLFPFESNCVGWKYITRPSKFNDVSKYIQDLVCIAPDYSLAYIGNGNIYKSSDQGKTWDSIYELKQIPQDISYPTRNINFNLYYEDCYCGEWFYTNKIEKISNDFKKTETVLVKDTSSIGYLLYGIFMLDTLNGLSENQDYIEYKDKKNYKVGPTYFEVSHDGWKTRYKRVIPEKFEGVFPFYSLDSANLLCGYMGPKKIFVNGDSIVRGGIITKYNFYKDEWELLHEFPGHSIDYEGPFTYGPLNKQMLNDSVGYGMHARSKSFSVDDNGKYFDVIFKTTDGGRNWSKLMDTLREGNSWDIQDISFYDEKNGIVVGRFGKILMTNDGGKTWIEENREEFKRLKTTFVMFIDWAGQFPIIGTRLDGDIYRYEGNFFKFDFKSPELFYPKDKEVAIPISPIFRWEELRDATSYKYELSNTSDFKSIMWEFSGKNINYKYNTFEPFTEYWWRVSSTDGKETKVSSPAKFRTKMPFISTTAPDCGATEQNFTVKFNWQSVKGAEKYRIRLSKDSKFGTISHEKDEIIDLETEIPGLDELTSYFWQVQPYRSDETGDWSNVCSFTTKKSTSVGYSDEQNIRIKPNPAGDFITIQFQPSEGFEPSEGYRAQIFDVLGIELMSVETGLDLSKQRIDVSNLPAGVYFIRIDGMVEKFVKM
jgi:hypothetical protein